MVRGIRRISLSWFLMQRIIAITLCSVACINVAYFFLISFLLPFRFHHSYVCWFCSFFFYSKWAHISSWFHLWLDKKLVGECYCGVIKLKKRTSTHLESRLKCGNIPSQHIHIIVYKLFQQIYIYIYTRYTYTHTRTHKINRCQFSSSHSDKCNVNIHFISSWSRRILH